MCARKRVRKEKNKYKLKKKQVELKSYPLAYPDANRLRTTVNIALSAGHVRLSAHAAVAPFLIKRQLRR